MAGKTYLDQLSGVPLFSGLNRKELQQVAKAADEIDLRAGQTLTEQGEPGKEMFVLLSGTATVRRNGRKIATLGAGASVGELAILDRGERTATVILDTDATVLVLGAGQFLGVLENVPAVARKVMANLAAKVRQLDQAVYG